MENLANGQTNLNPNGAGEKDIDLEFLPLIYEIIRSIERDPTHENTQKSRETQDTSAKIIELEAKLIQAREQINQLPGIEHSQEEQLKQVENLRKQLFLKRQLLNKYHNMCSFSMPKNTQLVSKLAETPLMRRAAQLFVYHYYKHWNKFLEMQNKAGLQNLKITEKLKKISEELENQNKKLK